ncbi:hypothetical protein E3O45_02460 [Cryobacterium sp. TMS1-20-1]|uniref:Aconitate hydratase n=1 Tax=Cryobacterium levicorallinum TaxID=995038 RepID=A0A1I3DY89_9MICO|nr:hypothetical protein E3O11_10345 [Cryobacterium levicorallinum]TFC80298.1 hypothetical protein E3O45_02460 [Cryobacterium sp. TMS1-20-1]GEP28662.1 hypothetical protein CLE01_32600 [Cryobacterium levicorallinum]SFH91613.1 hypothetical protein SAMN05216274_12149 [Cryobacterium levicorallinum]
MAYNVSQKLIASHLASGEMVPGTEIGLQIDQTLAQDATGTLVMLELGRGGPRFSSLRLTRVRPVVFEGQHGGVTPHV